MGRPRTLTDEERKARNVARQARWREKHRGYERLRAKNNYAKAKEVAETPKAKASRELAPLPHYGEIRYQDIPGVDTDPSMEPNQKGGQREDQGDHRKDWGPGISGEAEPTAEERRRRFEELKRSPFLERPSHVGIHPEALNAQEIDRIYQEHQGIEVDLTS